MASSLSLASLPKRDRRPERTLSTDVKSNALAKVLLVGPYNFIHVDADETAFVYLDLKLEQYHSFHSNEARGRVSASGHEKFIGRLASSGSAHVPDSKNAAPKN